MDWDTEVLGEMAGGGVNDRFLGYWDYETRKTMPLILAHIPVKHPWEVFAYLPFGGWNECPDTDELMAVTKYWFEQYGAVPAVMTHDVLEFDLPAPVPQERAMEVAQEQYAFCPDVVDQGGRMPRWAPWRIRCGSRTSGISGGIDNRRTAAETTEEQQRKESWKWDLTFTPEH